MPFINFMNITRALSDENRVRILMALRGRELCVCQITAFLDLSPSTTSKHLSVLKQSRLIEAKKDGKWVYYRLSDSSDSYTPALEAIEWTERSIADAQIIRRDELRIEQILEDERMRFGVDDNVHTDEFHSIALHSIDDTAE